MDWAEIFIGSTIGIALFIPIGILIIVFYNKVFWFVGGLLKIKNPFWRIRIGGSIVLIIYTLILINSGIVG